MVAPLDIIVTHGGQHIQNLSGSGTTIEDIADDMQRINGERMNEIGNDDDELVGTACLNDSIDDSVVISLSVMLLQIGFMQ